MTHKHEPWGTEVVLVDQDEYTMVSAQCLCGVWLIRETAPVDAKFNWQDWRVTK